MVPSMATQRYATPEQQLYLKKQLEHAHPSSFHDILVFFRPYRGVDVRFRIVFRHGEYESTGIWNFGLWYPMLAINKLIGREASNPVCWKLFDTIPFHSIGLQSSRPSVVEFCVKQCLEREGLVPWQPSIWLDQVIKERFHDNGSGEFFPWPAKVCLVRVPHRIILWISYERAVLEDETRRLANVFSALSCYNAVLIAQRLSHHQCAALENGSAVSKDKVDGA
ncbi:hypothetical protein OROGR_031702 [Orobanche gracilis]